jgi:hypothetical protein
MCTKGKIVRCVALSVFLVVLIIPIRAMAIVVKINQSKATNGNVTPGDAPGFPVTISRPGSYRLTSNLTVPNENTTAVEITTDDVTLDLGGFLIKGPTVCSSGNPVNCSPIGTGDGVNANGRTNITVVNGTVRGMGDDGIVGGKAYRVEDVHVISNGGDGIVGGYGIVKENTATLNGGNGIIAGGVITGNTVLDNGQDGISAAEGLVLGNTAIDNAGFGLNQPNNGGYANNVFTFNNSNGNQVDGSSNEIGFNVCGADTICP